MSTAAIMLRTGLPGAGKTLFTLDEVHQLAQREPDVTVYYSGIADLRVPGWVELDDATKWHELPPKSVCIIDEAQRVFRPRHTGSSVPEHVAKLETIRHQGVRLFVITQHPKLLDPNLRRLVGDHSHYVRAFGSNVVRRHAWSECYEDPDKTRTDSIVTTASHPKHVYGWYKSAEVHTVKRKVPARFVAVLVLPLLVIALGWGAFKVLNRNLDGKRIGDQVNATAPASSDKMSGQPPGRRPDPAKTAAEWVAEQQPRVAGLAHTAPVYDQLTAPRSTPHPAACMTMGGKCRCYTDQGTVLDTPKPLCESIVERGFFVAWREPAGREPRSVPQEDGRAPARAAQRSTPASFPSASPRLSPAEDPFPASLLNPT